MNETQKNVTGWLKDILVEVKEVVSVAGTSPTALTALGILLLSLVVLLFFRQSSDTIKIIALVIMVISNL